MQKAIDYSTKMSIESTIETTRIKQVRKGLNKRGYELMKAGNIEKVFLVFELNA